MTLIEVAAFCRGYPFHSLGLANLAQGNCGQPDVSHALFSLLANPMEELSTSEVNLLGRCLASTKGDCKSCPAPTEQLCYYSLHDRCLSVTLGAHGTEAFRLVEDNCSDAASETMVLMHEG